MYRALFFLIMVQLVSCNKEAADLSMIKYTHLKLFNNDIEYSDTLYLLKNDLNDKDVGLKYLSDRSDTTVTSYHFVFKPSYSLTYYDNTTFKWKLDTLRLGDLITPLTIFDYNMEDAIDEESQIFIYDKKVILIYNYSWLVVDRFDFDDNTKMINDIIIERLRNKNKFPEPIE